MIYHHDDVSHAANYDAIVNIIDCGDPHDAVESDDEKTWQSEREGK